VGGKGRERRLSKERDSRKPRRRCQKPTLREGELGRGVKRKVNRRVEIVGFQRSEKVSKEIGKSRREGKSAGGKTAWCSAQRVLKRGKLVWGETMR